MSSVGRPLKDTGGKQDIPTRLLSHTVGKNNFIKQGKIDKRIKGQSSIQCKNFIDASSFTLSPVLSDNPRSGFTWFFLTNLLNLFPLSLFPEILC